MTEKISKELLEWCHKDEKLHARKNEEYFKLTAGLDYDKRLLKDLEKQSAVHATNFLERFKDPEILRLTNIATIAGSHAHRAYLDFYETRNKVITAKYKLGGKEVNWATWRQFVSLKSEPKVRKEVYDTFVKKTKLISPLIERHFNIYKKIFSSYKINILDFYLKYQPISEEELLELIESMKQKAKKPFQELATYYGDKLLAKPLEYYDDLYFVRNFIFNEFVKDFRNLDPLVKVRKSLNNLGINTEKIKVDSESREGKNPSASCHFVKIPGDVRVLFKKENPVNDFSSVYHEFGHAIHGSSISERLPYWTKYCLSSSLAEIFSIFLEQFFKSDPYLRNLIGKRAEELRKRYDFTELFFVSFYSANSLLKLKYWKKNLSIEQANELYSRLTEECMGIRYPGQYWQLHHIMPDSLIYEPSYLIAAVRAAELEEHILNRFGEKWWEEKDAGKFLKEIMSQGRDLNVGKFSKLNVNLYFKKLDL
ncbi:MAG: hypothetical protein AABX59_03780 [Nanoarchaeota archaeon]